MPASRFPGWVYREGSEPDPRISLANERTFLAWIRTAVALFAAGVAIEALNLAIDPGLRIAAAVLFVALGSVATVQSWLGWAHSERSLRHGSALPGPSLSAVVTGGVLLAMALVAIGLLV